MRKKTEPELVGVKEIARRANVSIGTVDRVLNNRTGVSAKTKENILEIIKELDYKPNIMARRLASKKVLKIAVLIPAVSKETGYWSVPLAGINQAAEEIFTFGVKVFNFLFDLNDKSTFDEQAKLILRDEFDGILLAPMFEKQAMDFLNICHARQIPYVLINSDLDEHHRVCYIGPNLYQSGYLAAHITNYVLKENSKALVINITKEVDRHHHLLKKEEGFRAYFNSVAKSIAIDTIDIHDTDYDSIKLAITKALHREHFDLLFVTNSRVFSVAKYLKEANVKGVKLIGYDFIGENVDFLKEGVVDFLICQKPQEQGYKGIMAIHQHLNGIGTIEKTQYMPIDILTKENHQYYKN